MTVGGAALKRRRREAAIGYAVAAGRITPAEVAHELDEAVACGMSEDDAVADLHDCLQNRAMARGLAKSRRDGDIARLFATYPAAAVVRFMRALHRLDDDLAARLLHAVVASTLDETVAALDYHRDELPRDLALDAMRERYAPDGEFDDEEYLDLIDEFVDEVADEVADVDGVGWAVADYDTVARVAYWADELLVESAAVAEAVAEAVAAALDATADLVAAPATPTPTGGAPPPLVLLDGPACRGAVVPTGPPSLPWATPSRVAPMAA